MKEQLQYTDYIARIYPELLVGDPFGPDRVLSRTITFQVTDACNLACKYCYQINKQTRSMDFAIAKRAVDNLLTGNKGFKDYINPTISPGIILEFIGGEPFLEIDLIDQIVDYFRLQTIKLRHPWADKFMVSICSNGVLYRDERVQRFLQKNYDVLSFSVTVDGTKELHDACRVFPDGSPSYHLAHDAATDWKGRGYYMGSKITIAPDNIQFLADSLMQMVRDGYTEINANCVYENVWKDSDATTLYYQCKRFADKFLKDYDLDNYSISLLDESYGKPMSVSDNDNWCGGTGIMLAIDPDGKLFPCLRYMDSSLGGKQPPLIIGDVWKGIATKPCECETINCLHCITRRSQSTDECFYCPISKGCSWCSAYNYQETGDPNKRVTYICELHKARSLACVYLWNTYHLSKHDGLFKDLYVPESWAIPIIGRNEYEMLVELTLRAGGSVNKNITRYDLEELQNV